MAPRRKQSIAAARPSSVEFKIDSRSGLIVPGFKSDHPEKSTGALHHNPTARPLFYRTKFKLLAKLSVRKSPRTSRHVVDDMFLGGTTGLDRLIGTYGNRFRFTIWLVTYVSLVCCLGYYVNGVLTKYFQYGTAISIGTLEAETLEFPAVTICNLNYLRKSSFCRDNTIFPVFRHRICSQADQTRQNVFLMLSLSPGIMNKSLEKEYRGRVLDSVRQHTIHWSSVIKACQLSRKNCLRSDLITMRAPSNPEYGQCFTLFERHLRRNLTGDEREEILEITNPTDPSEGLHLVLDLNEDEYLPYQTEKGFVLMVHSIVDAADVSRGGIYVPADRRTYVAIEKETVRLLEAPYDTRCQPEKTWPQDILNLNPYLADHLRGKRYSAVICEFICRAINVIYVCDCENRRGNFDYALTCTERMSRPGHETNFTCKDEFTRAPLDTARKYNRPIRCFCPPKCRDAVFVKQVSYTHLRSETSYTHAQQSRKKYAEVFVYFKDINEEILFVSPTYSTGKMMNEVGGFLGSFVGMAFISIYEIVETIVFTVLHLFPSRSHPRL